MATTTIASAFLQCDICGRDYLARRMGRCTRKTCSQECHDERKRRTSLENLHKRKALGSTLKRVCEQCGDTFDRVRGDDGVLCYGCRIEFGEPEPTDAIPGSAAKVEILQIRVATHTRLWSERDRRMGE